MRTENTRGVLFALADGTTVIEQRTNGCHADREVRAKHVLAEVIEEYFRHRRLEKSSATQMTWRAECVFTHIGLPQHRGEHRRQQVLAITPDRRFDPPR